MEESSNNKEKGGFFSSIIKYSISTWVNLILGFIFAIVTTRLLEPSVYGMVSLFNNSSNTLMYFITLGLDSSYIRFYNEPPHGEKRNVFSFKTIIISSIILLLSFFFITTFFFDWFNEKMFGRVSWLLTILLMTSVFSNIILRYLNITYRMSFNTRQYTIQNILVQSATKLLVVIAAFINPSYEAVLSLQVIGIFLIAVVYSFVQRGDIIPENSKDYFSRKTWNLSGYGQVFWYALFSAPVYIITNLNIVLIQQTIRDKISPDALGIYSSVNFFSSLFAALQTGFATFWAAYVYENYNKEQNKIVEMTNYIFLASIDIFALFVMFKDIIYLFIGIAYQESKAFFSLIIISKILGLMSQATIYGISIAKKNYIETASIITYSILDVGIAWVVAGRYGLIAVAFVEAISSLLYFSINTFFGQRFYRTIYDVPKFIYSMAAICIIALLPTIEIKTIYTSMVALILMCLTFIVFKNQTAYLYRKSVNIIQSYIIKGGKK